MISTPPARNVLAIAKYSTSGAVLWQRYIETDSYEFAESRAAVRLWRSWRI
jgi:hypothetical protein